MKKMLVVLLFALALTGCATEPTWETLEDVMPVEPIAAMQQLYAPIPGDATAPTFSGDDGTEVYVCGDFTLTKQILPGGDLNRTVKEISGMEKDQLQLLETNLEGYDRWDTVWTSATEEGLQITRACILDDGGFHYVLSTTAEESEAGALADTWQDIFSRCCLLPEGVDLSIGS